MSDKMDERLAVEARVILDHIANAAISIAVERHDLDWAEGDEITEGEIIQDVIASMTGEDPGCLDLDDPDDRAKLELEWLKTRLLAAVKDARREASVCEEIQRIMRVYREQAATDHFGTPGGLEHMGDVWRLLGRWDDILRKRASEL